MDECSGTCDKRFAGPGIPQTEAARRDWRDLLVTTSHPGDHVSGAILSDETIRQRKKGRTAFVRVLEDAGIILGIKVDVGAKALAGLPGETVTEGLDGLRSRLQDYVCIGARFAKWRAVISEGKIALFSHGHFGMVLHGRWIGPPVIEALHLALSKASVGVLGYGARIRMCL